MLNLHDLRSDYGPKLEKFFVEFLERAKQDGLSLNVEMTNYQLGTGGKRIRALIPLALAQQVRHSAVPNKEPDIDSFLKLGMSIEMIHNATLVHDDWQDGDVQRRGKPTVWKKYSDVQAINCGDAMFQFVFQILADLHFPAATVLSLIRHAARSTLHVIEGQAQEFQMKEERYPGVTRYESVIRGKTSGLFALPVVGGLLALGYSEADAQIATHPANRLGMLFQIQDDLLDLYGSKGRERIGTDIAEGKISMLVAHVNDFGLPQHKEQLANILVKSRSETTQQDIEQAVAIFDTSGAKARAVSELMKLQDLVLNDNALKAIPILNPVFKDLIQIVLEPIHGLL